MTLPPQGQDPNQQQTPEGQNPPGTQQATPPAQQQDQVPDWVRDPDAAYREITRLRGEAAQNRVALNTMRTQMESLQTTPPVEPPPTQQQAPATQQTTPSSQPPAQVEATLQDFQEKMRKLEEGMRQSGLRAEVLAEAGRLKFVDPQDAYNLIDRSKVTISDDGVVTGAKEALEALAQQKPYLISKTGHTFPQGLGATNPSGTQKTGSTAEERVRSRLQGSGPTFGDGGVIIRDPNARP
jgi:hypothetical protein